MLCKYGLLKFHEDVNNWLAAAPDLHRETTQHVKWFSNAPGSSSVRPVLHSSAVPGGGLAANEGGH